MSEDQVEIEETAEDVLADYFQNDAEGWQRGYNAWRKRAKKVLDLEEE